MALALASCLPASAAANDKASTVLVLFSDEGRLPSTSAVFDGVASELRGDPTITLLSQFLDSSNFAGDAHELGIATFLHDRYAGRDVDVVIAVGPPAAVFAERYKSSIWPGARTIAIGFADDPLSKEALATTDSMVALELDYRATANAALTLFPRTRRIVLIGGSSQGDLRYFNRARKDLAPLASRVALVEWQGLPLSQVQERLSALDDNAVVLPVMFFEDADGRRFLPVEAIQEMAASSRRPIFGVHDSWMGNGVTGGHMLDYEGAGRKAARAAVLMLNGERAPRTVAPNRWIFDARELTRWRVDSGALPVTSELRNQPLGAWARYGWYLVGAVVLLSAQGIAIGALLVERRARRRTLKALTEAETARKKTEAQMKLQLHELAHVNLLATIGQTAAAMAHELNQPITAVLSNAQALRRVLKRDGPLSPLVSEMLDDIISEDRRAGEVIQRMRRLVKKERFDWVPLDLNAIVHDVTRMMAHEAANAGVRLQMELAAGLPATRGDRIQLQQVMLNLVQNAVHACAGTNSERGVCVTTVREDIGIRVSVTDSGPGVEREVLPRLFEPFLTTKANGLGLGLSISRTIVEQHGGSIRAANKPAGGAVFSVRLPALEGV